MALQADSDISLNISHETLKAFQNPPPAAHALFDPGSLVLRIESFQPQNILKNIQDAIERDASRKALEPLLAKTKTSQEFTLEECRTLLTPHLAHTTREERSEILRTLLRGTVDTSDVEAVLNVLRHDSYGLSFTLREASRFFRTLTTDSAQALTTLLAVLPSQKQSEVIFDVWLQSRLEELRLTLPTSAQNSPLYHTDRPVRERLEMLNSLSPQERLRFAREIISLQSNDASHQSFITDKLDNVLSHLLSEERFLLLKEGVGNTGTIVSHILRSAPSLRELENLVHGVGIEKLSRYEDSSIDEFLAMALLLPKLRENRFPVPSESSTQKELELCYEKVVDIVKNIPNIIYAHPELRHTSTAHHLLSTVVTNLIELEEDWRENNESTQSSLDVLRRHIKTMELEFRYCIDISSKDSIGHELHKGCEEVCRLSELEIILGPEELSNHRHTSGERKTYWDMESLLYIEKVLQSIPEDAVLFSPLLHRIELVESLGEGVLGARFIDGTIQIADLSINHRGISEAYNNTPSLMVVLAHEIGHGVQIGSGSSQHHFPLTSSQPFFGYGELQHDFDEWVRLSDWSLYQRELYSVATKTGHILLKGEEIPLGTPVEWEGKQRIFLYNPWYDILTSYDASSEFSSRWYSRTSPWEDFAEAFSEYILVPERLLADAPRKFLHLELELGRYKTNKEIHEKLFRELFERVKKEDR